MSARHAIAGLLALAFPALGAGWGTDSPEDYGCVVLNHSSQSAGMGPVRFDHWRHRSRYTCRLCHVDIGFAMSAGATGISASTNGSGFHCGACHNGKAEYAGTPIFAACEKTGTGSSPRCERCHGKKDREARRAEYEDFAARMPRIGATGGVDWEKAESTGHIRPIDELEGVSIKRARLRHDTDVVIRSRSWAPDVVFSHRKHAVWNGCEVCHPEIFAPGAARYTMLEINAGEACGVCHGKVAFAIRNCERCHGGPALATGAVQVATPLAGSSGDPGPAEGPETRNAP